MKQRYILFIMLFILLPKGVAAQNSPITFIDSSGKEIILQKPPQRVVSLVPSITEILLRIGAAESVIGITYHSILPPESSEKEIIGSFLNPNLDRVATLEPDLIFYSDLQKDIPIHFQDKTILVQLAARSIAEGFDHIRLLGRIFQKEENAVKIIAEEKRQLELISKKVAQIPEEKRLRVLRLMGRNSVMTPGDDSFQNEFIKAAGAIAPEFGKNGNIIPVSLAQWRKFNPQLIYGCGGDREILQILDQPGWRDVDGVRNKQFSFFPCDLTCRAATHSGYFVSWLAARIYSNEFSDKNNFVLPEQVVSRSPIIIDLDYIKKAEIIHSDIKDFRNKTLALTFKHPMNVVSTLEGQKSGILTVANHYFPPQSWGLGSAQGLAALRESALRTLRLDTDSTAMLFTGADMNNLAVVKEVFKDMEVVALVTAGVNGNAVRMSSDTGFFYEPDSNVHPKKTGTINILLLSNMQLSSRAMTRAIISITEAKSAALQDMDIRSSYSSGSNQATGTGTDNIIVVEGTGEPIDSSGGHTKMGELMARAVYKGVQKAIYQQNGLKTARSVFQRLKERKISLHAICNRYTEIEQSEKLCRQMEVILLQPEYADFLKAIMSMSDHYENGLIEDLSSLDLWCRTIAEKIGGPDTKIPIKEMQGLPRVLAKGFGALLSGAAEKIAQN